MRAVRRNFHKVKFHRIETLPLKTIYGDVPITWNTQKHAIAAKITRPLLHVVQPDEWSRMRRASFAADSWLVDERSETEEVDAWAK